MTKINHPALDYVCEVAEESGFDVLSVMTANESMKEPVVVIRLRQKPGFAPQQIDPAVQKQIEEAVAEYVNVTLAHTQTRVETTTLDAQNKKFECL